MSKTFNDYISQLIGKYYKDKERTEDEKQEYEDELKNSMFNIGFYHGIAEKIEEKEYMKIFKTLYYYYKESYDMGEKVVDAIDDKEKLFNLYALMVFDDVVRNKLEEEENGYEQCETCGGNGTHGEFDGFVWCKECYYEGYERELTDDEPDEKEDV